MKLLRFSWNMESNSFMKEKKGNLSHLCQEQKFEKFSMSVPYVGAIIERENEGDIEVLIQTRWKPESDLVYSGTFEFPAGTVQVVLQDID